MLNLEGRVRKVNVENLSNEELETLSKDLSTQVFEIIKQTNAQVNRLLNIYGLETRVQIVNPVPIGTLEATHQE